MEHKEHDRVSAFDTLFTNNHIRMLKIVMPLFEPSMQRHIAVYIKYLELQYTLSYFNKYNLPPFSGSVDTHTLLGDIIPYCSPEEKIKVKQIENLFSTLENYQNMMDMFSMMKEMFPEGEGMPSGDMMSGLFGGNEMDMSDIFQMFQNNNTGNHT